MVVCYVNFDERFFYQQMEEWNRQKEENEQEKQDVVWESCEQ